MLENLFGKTLPNLIAHLHLGLCLCAKEFAKLPKMFQWDKNVWVTFGIKNEANGSVQATRSLPKSTSMADDRPHFLQGCEADSLGLVPKLHSWHEIGENKLVAMSFGEVLQSTEPLSSFAKSGLESR